MKRISAAVLSLVFVLAVCAPWIAPYRSDEQCRDEASVRAGRNHWLGTDELGRDRFSRLLYGARVSLLLAPSAAALATAIATAAGLAGGGLGGAPGKGLMLAADVFLGIPWLFLLLGVRAALPLNAGPAQSLFLTFALLGLLGWPSGARVMHATCSSVRSASFILQAEAAGQARRRLLIAHLAPHLRPVILAQFLLAIPAFLLAEANLGMLGLGVTEPLPSLGNLLAELTTLPRLAQAPGILAPAILLIAVLSAFQILLPSQRSQT